MQIGYVKFHRQFLDWEWYGNVNCRLTFMHLLLSVNYEPNRWKGMIVQRGQTVTAYGKLSEAIGISIQNLKTVFKKLKSTGEIKVKSTNKFIVVTLVNFDVWQGDKEIINEQLNNNQLSIKEQLTTLKEVKKERKKEKSSSIPSAFPTLAELNSTTDPDTRQNKFMTFGLKDAKLTLENIFPTAESFELRVSEVLGIGKSSDWCSGRKESFIKEGIPNYYNKVQNVDKLKASLDNWIRKGHEYDIKNPPIEEEQKIEEYKEVIQHYMSETGRKIKTHETDELILRSDKYKKLKNRLNSHSLKECKQVISLKCKEWLNDAKMEKFATIEVLFGRNFEKYIDELQTNPQNNLLSNKSLLEYYKTVIREKDVAHMVKNGEMERLQEVFNKSYDSLKVESLSFLNPSVTPFLIFEITHTGLGRYFQGSTAKRQYESFKRWYSELSDYQQKKAEIRELVVQYQKNKKL